MSPRRLLITLVVALSAWAGVALAGAGGARADATQTSIMQDDTYLISSSTATVVHTLETMEQLGVQTVRVNLQWRYVAPDPLSSTPPPGFNPADPADYPSANWAPYDRLADLAPLYGITVQYNLTGPGPLWAQGSGAPTAKAAAHWEPNALDFYQFVYAVGLRYSGQDGPARVSQWSIWNEPNQPGWLAPQWLSVDHRLVPESPQYYRRLVNAGYYALAYSGHTVRTDTVLIGETAPEGADRGGFYTAMTPLPFLRALYCVNARERPLRGAAAIRLGCPASGSPARFARANAALFDATGYAHHPYDFTHSPTTNLPDPNDVPLADLGRLQRFLDATFRTYGVHRQIPIYLTEYGYETRPPNPYRGVPLSTQAAYLNESDYLAWRNPRVRSVSQFLLYDSPPNLAFTPTQRDYWDTFQTGLLFLNGTPKPSLAAYRMPIWLPRTHVRAGAATFVWGQVRPADRLDRQPVALQWRSPHGRWRTLTVADTRGDSGYFTATVHLPGSGELRSRWRGPDPVSPHPVTVTLTSRLVPVLVEGRRHRRRR